MEVQISAVIITYNEGKNIDRCLRSLHGIVNEILVVDSNSQDNTEEICKQHSVRFVSHKFQGHIEQKNYAMMLATHDYILSLDGDEALSDELRENIAWVKASWKTAGYSFNRLNNFRGQWIRHCGWYPDRKIRLWDRRKGKWGGVNPHDKVIMNEGALVTQLSGDLLHYTYSSIAELVVQINYFSDISAREYYLSGKRATFFNLAISPFFSFFRAYFIKRGFLDGFNGFVICIVITCGNFLKYAKLHALRKEKRSDIYDYSTVESKRSINYDRIGLE